MTTAATKTKEAMIYVVSEYRTDINFPWEYTFSSKKLAEERFQLLKGDESSTNLKLVEMPLHDYIIEKAGKFRSSCLAIPEQYREGDSLKFLWKTIRTKSPLTICECVELVNCPNKELTHYFLAYGKKGAMYYGYINQNRQAEVIGCGKITTATISW